MTPADFTQVFNRRHVVHHDRGTGPGAYVETLNSAYGKHDWSVRLIDRVHWGLYIWHPLTPSDNVHGAWRMGQITRAHSYDEAVGVFPRAIPDLSSAGL